MTLLLYAHPFSSYCWKALIALYENATPFEQRILDAEHPENASAFAARWPLCKMPLLIDGDTAVAESTIIIEYLMDAHPGRAALLPGDAAAVRTVRLLDRVFDNYVMTPMTKMVGNAMRGIDDRDAAGVADARALLDKSYAWLDTWLAGRTWAAGDAFTLADCAGAPAVFYADWVHPIPEACATLKAYRARLLARPSVARCVDDARPYRALFPPGAPDRD